MSFVMNPTIAFVILCALGESKDSGPFANSVTYSQLTSLCHWNRQIHLNHSCFCGSTGTPRTRGNLMFWLKMGWHVAGIAGLVARGRYSYIRYCFIFVPSFCFIYADNFKLKLFPYLRSVVSQVDILVF
jgi:hypothetical protein